MTTFLSNRNIYESVSCGIVPQVKERQWIATAVCIIVDGVKGKLT